MNRRRSAFERDFHDLHGHVLEAVPERLGAYRVATPAAAVDHVGLRLIIGFLGLFWALIFGVILLGMFGLAGVAVWALATT